MDPIFVKDAMSSIIGDAVFSNSFPRPFISSAERTGVAIFRKELNFARNRLLKEMVRTDQQTDLPELLSKAYQSYPAPIENNVDFMGQLEDIAKRKSFIAKEHTLKFWKTLRTLSAANMSLHKTTNSTIFPKARGLN